MPLIIRGPRQVGKSYLVEKFGKNHFKQLITLNFELSPHFKNCFNDLEPASILNQIELTLGVNIAEEPSTLLFLDEIQECPQAILALRYFKEKKPEIPVIAAGSLLEFALDNADFRMPVGRVQYLYLRPLSFEELFTRLHDSILAAISKKFEFKSWKHLMPNGMTPSSIPFKR